MSFARIATISLFDISENNYNRLTQRMPLKLQPIKRKLCTYFRLAQCNSCTADVIIVRRRRSSRARRMAWLALPISPIVLSSAATPYLPLVAAADTRCRLRSYLFIVRIIYHIFFIYYSHDENDLM